MLLLDVQQRLLQIVDALAKSSHDAKQTVTLTVQTEMLFNAGSLDELYNVLGLETRQFASTNWELQNHKPPPPTPFSFK